MNFNIENRLISHIKRFWPNEERKLLSWERGGITESNPHFRVCRISPSEKGKSWVYISIGASEYLNSEGEHLEFALLAPKEGVEHVETLAMVTHFHANETFRLKLGKVVDIGSGWVEGSKCDHLLVSLPYFKGPEFEICDIEGHILRLLWLVPITREESIYVKKFGVEALETEFERNKIRITDPFRNSVI